MQKGFREVRFYESYYFAQAVKNMLADRFNYLRELSEFYGDGNFLTFTQPFPKYSAFHNFIEFVVDRILHDENCEVDLASRQRDVADSRPDYGWNPRQLPIDEAFSFYDIENATFEQWLTDQGSSFLKAEPDDISDYMSELMLSSEYELLLQTIVQDVFFIVFQNRQLLLLFNDMMADQVASSDHDEISDEYSGLFARPGALRRVDIPQWVKDAVYFRDRGKCVICGCDLSRTLSRLNVINYDHIVALANGGLNDVTNVQVLCKACNQAKLHGEASTSNFYETWYQM
jgi:hypothetical protein